MKTILLTGITGFLAKRIAFDLLEDGYAVRGSLRSPDRADEVRAALAPRLSDPALLDHLSFIPLDMTTGTGWLKAMRGIDAVIHTAAPYPLGEPEDEDAVIRPAVEGAKRALGAAQKAGVTRVVMTSSIVAIHASDPPGLHFTEANWSEDGHPMMSAYAKAKTRAERAAWDFVKTHPEMQLSTINPVLICGTPMDARYGTSLQVLENVLKGRDPILPRVGFGVVDIEDVSRAHLRALELPEAIGKRFILSGGWMTLPEIGALFARAFPASGASGRTAPDALFRLAALFNARARSILPSLGRTEHADTTAARDVLGIDFVPAKEAVLRSGRFLIGK